MGTSYVLKFTDDQSKEVTNLLASVYDAQMSGIAQFIDGTRELTPDNWVAFQQEMNDLGLSRIEEVQLAAYQAMYGACCLDKGNTLTNQPCPTRQTAMRAGLPG